MNQPRLVAATAMGDEVFWVHLRPFKKRSKAMYIHATCDRSYLLVAKNFQYVLEMSGNSANALACYLIDDNDQVLANFPVVSDEPSRSLFEGCYAPYNKGPEEGRCSYRLQIRHGEQILGNSQPFYLYSSQHMCEEAKKSQPRFELCQAQELGICCSFSAGVAQMPSYR